MTAFDPPFVPLLRVHFNDESRVNRDAHSDVNIPQTRCTARRTSRPCVAAAVTSRTRCASEVRARRSSFRFLFSVARPSIQTESSINTHINVSRGCAPTGKRPARKKVVRKRRATRVLYMSAGEFAHTHTAHTHVLTHILTHARIHTHTCGQEEVPVHNSRFKFE